MSISSLLERLREKPKEVRVQVSFLSALCVTGVIGVLWGMTVPTRLGGLSQSDQEGQTEDGRTLSSFFSDTRNNLGQIIGAGGEPAPTDAQNELIDSAPKSDAYTAGAPPAEPRGYYDDPLEAQQPVVTPVNRQEVRIGTTTSKTTSQ